MHCIIKHYHDFLYHYPRAQHTLVTPLGQLNLQEQENPINFAKEDFTTNASPK